jgi:hypothetical protein
VLVAAGTVCRESAGACDVAETCSGTAGACPDDVLRAAGTSCDDDGDACTLDTCDAAGACTHPPAADGDADGTCDAQDPCTNVGGAQTFVAGSKLRLTRIGADPTPGDDGLVLGGTFDLPAGRAFAALRPDVTGVRLVVSAHDGGVLVDVALPGGAYGGKDTRGWLRAGSGKAWTYVDKTTAPVNGIVKFQVGDKSRPDGPTRTKITVSGKRGSYAVAIADAPLAASVTLGTQADAMAGLCGETAYPPAACRSNGAGTVLGCRD